MNEKQTAVEWLENAIYKYIDYVEGSHKAEPFTVTQLSEAVEQAKEMEKQQIMDAFKYGELPKLFRIISAEQYYNEEYGER